MRWYKGVQADDPRTIGGGAYNETELGHEVFNFLPMENRYFGYFEPQSQRAEAASNEPAQHSSGKN